MNIEITIIPDDALGSFSVQYKEMFEHKQDLNVSLLTLSVPETMKLVSDLLMCYVESRTSGREKKEQQAVD